MPAPAAGCLYSGRKKPTICKVKRTCRRQSGTTLVELLATLVFLSLCVAPMLAAITSTQSTAASSSDRMLVMAVVADAIESYRGTAETYSLTPSGTSTQVTVAGVYTKVQLNKTVSLVSGYTDLYLVTVTASWGSATMPNRNGSITVSTYMRAPHA